ncbi:hypothetical protein GCM10020367_51590 [Streptomyces sannanensis]|uniref:Transposase n=1 Tax=Streptomyces sannanensis TaxID=285536 RepID=A0ABP6SI43_9ACTN
MIAASQDLDDTLVAGVQQLRHTSIEPTHSVSDRMVLRRNAPRRHRNGPSTPLARHVKAAHGTALRRVRQVDPVIVKVPIPNGAGI